MSILLQLNSGTHLTFNEFTILYTVVILKRMCVCHWILANLLSLHHLSHIIIIVATQSRGEWVFYYNSHT